MYTTNAETAVTLLKEYGFLGVYQLKTAPNQYIVVVPYVNRNMYFSSLASVKKYIAQLKKEKAYFINR